MVTETEKSTVKAPISVRTCFTKVCYFIYQWNMCDKAEYVFLEFFNLWLFEIVTHLPAANKLKTESNISCIQTQFCSEQVCLQKY